MSFGFKNIEHALAVVAQDVVKGAKAVESFVAKVGPTEAIVEGVTALTLGSGAVTIERGAYAALGLITKAANDVTDVTNAKGLSLDVDATMIADFKALYKLLHDEVTKQGIPAPAPSA